MSVESEYRKKISIPHKEECERALIRAGVDVASCLKRRKEGVFDLAGFNLKFLHPFLQGMYGRHIAYIEQMIQEVRELDNVTEERLDSMRKMHILSLKEDLIWITKTHYDNQSIHENEARRSGNGA